MKRAALLLWLAACGAGESVPPPPSTHAEVRGAVVDAQGAPWAGAKIQVCSAKVCTLGDADEAGAFAVAVPAGDLYHVIARPRPGDARDGSAGVAALAAPLATDTALAAPVVLPVTGARVALGEAPTDARVTNDLTLTAAAGDLEFPADPYVAAVRLAQDAWPTFRSFGSERSPVLSVLAVWALNPWATRAAPGRAVGVTIANEFGIPPGATASVYALSEATAELGPAAMATVSPDGTTLGGATVDRLTWIVLAR